MITYSPTYTQDIKNAFRNISSGKKDDYTITIGHFSGKPFGNKKLVMSYSIFRKKVRKHHLTLKEMLMLSRSEVVLVFRYAYSNKIFNLFTNLVHIENNVPGLLMIGINIETNVASIADIRTIHRRELDNIKDWIDNRKLIYAKKPTGAALLWGNAPGAPVGFMKDYAKKPTGAALLWGNTPGAPVGFMKEFNNLFQQIDHKYNTKVASGEMFFSGKTDSGLSGTPTTPLLFKEGVGGGSNNQTIKNHTTMKLKKSKYEGWTAFADRRIHVRQAPGTHTKVLYTAQPGEKIGIVLGLYPHTVNGYSWYVLVPAKAIPGVDRVYIASGLFKVKKLPPPKPDEVEQVINNMLYTDRQIALNIGKIYGLLAQKRKQGLVSDATYHTYKTTLKKMFAIIMEHQAMVLRYKPYLQVQTKLNSWVDSLKNWLGLGAVPLVVVIGLAAGVGALIAVVLYYIFKPRYDSSRINLKISKKLEQALNSLSPQDRQEVAQDLEHQIDNAYNQGRTDQSFASLGSWGKWMLLGAGVYLLTHKNNT